MASEAGPRGDIHAEEDVEHGRHVDDSSHRSFVKSEASVLHQMATSAEGGRLPTKPK